MGTMSRRVVFLFVIFILVPKIFAQTICVGAKNFNEGYLLSEMISQLIESRGFVVERKFNLGGTLICFSALNNGEIDVYPEYTGTISEQILESDALQSFNDLQNAVYENFNLCISKPYGFNNTYALATRRKTAERLKLKRISDLRNHSSLQMAFSYEFLKRTDGWKNLSKVYGLYQIPVGIEHALSYQALDEGTVDIIDIYSTDGEIPRYNLSLLKDDLGFFPTYYAVSFYRAELDPEVVATISLMHNLITGEEMQQLNARIVFGNEKYAHVAHDFLQENALVDQNASPNQRSFIREIWMKTLTHLQITFIALLAAMILAIPLGVFAYNFVAIGRPILYLTGLLQTIPSIALLAFMIPLFGIGFLPAVIALFLYALLPILRNTTSALFSIDPLLKRVATGIGLTRWQRLRHIEIPLAVPTVFAGIKTAAVINIGTATLAAFIGAGGLGEFIVTGLALNNTGMILKGAVPAAILAIVVEFFFELLEKWFVPEHLRQNNKH